MKAEKERREEAQILNEALPLKLSKNLPALEDLMEEMGNLPTPDITAEIMRHIDGVARVTQVSSNLKGTAKEVLNVAALNARAAITTLALRELETEASSSKEMEVLRRQVRLLKADNFRLAAEVESSRRSLADMGKEMKLLRASLEEVKRGWEKKSPTRKKGEERGVP